jgi:ABC-type molybdate transport system substrate-binding protein
MKVVTYEGVVENGRIHLPAGAFLPEKAKVYVVVPDAGTEPAVAYIASPRLANPEQAGDFIKEVLPERTDASL